MKVVFFILLLFVLSGCNDYNSQYVLFRSDIDEKFGSELISHFPNRLDYNHSSRVIFSYNADPIIPIKRNVASVIFELERDSLILFQNKIKEISKAVENPLDNCLLIINSLENTSTNLKDIFDNIGSNNTTSTNSKDCEDKLYKVQSSCDTLSLPVPNFSMITYGDLEIVKNNRLTDDFKLYILEAEQGKFLDKEMLSDGCGLPKEWKNGYSKGIAISEEKNLVLYWLEVW